MGDDRSILTEKYCPECNTLQPREKLQNCGLGSCDTITCRECQNDHCLNYHNEPKDLEDEEWEEIE